MQSTKQLRSTGHSSIKFNVKRSTKLVICWKMLFRHVNSKRDDVNHFLKDYSYVISLSHLTIDFGGTAFNENLCNNYEEPFEVNYLRFAKFYLFCKKKNQ